MSVAELRNEYHPKNGRNFGSRIDLKAIYDGLKLDEVGKREEDLIVARAKKITIKWYFVKLIRDKKHIRDIINEASIKKTDDGKK
jgi:hypothetical protein